MNFEKYSGKIINSILPNLQKNRGYKLLEDNDDFNSTLDSLLLLLYKEINESEKYMARNISSILQEPLLTKDIKQPIMTSTKYYPREIKEYIDLNIKYQLVYTLNIGKNKIKVYFSIFSERDIQHIEKYNKYIEFIISWLYICTKFSLHGNSKTLDIFLYLTPYKKKLPLQQGIILDAEHINTAFTRRCKENNEIILYREEEWKKVFIHETFHSFCFDIDESQDDLLNPYICKLFPIKSSFLVGESYVETWSRIINSAYVSYQSLGKKNDKETYLLYMKFSLQIERIHALCQMCKVLEFIGLSYYDIIDNYGSGNKLKRSLYNERTNVFEYYILTALFLNNYFFFLVWCAKNNSNIFNFSKTKGAVDEFKKFIETQYQDPTLRKSIDFICEKKNKDVHKGLSRRDKKYILYTTRMSAIELE